VKAQCRPRLASPRQGCARPAPAGLGPARRSSAGHRAPDEDSRRTALRTHNLCETSTGSRKFRLFRLFQLSCSNCSDCYVPTVPTAMQRVEHHARSASSPSRGRRQTPRRSTRSASPRPGSAREGEGDPPIAMGRPPSARTNARQLERLSTMRLEITEPRFGAWMENFYIFREGWEVRKTPNAHRSMLGICPAAGAH
jgi:hypothetical protein